MRYMFLIYTNEAEKLSQEDAVKLMAAHSALIAETKRRGIFEAAEPLRSTASATTVRVQNGKALTTDGPFAETKEQLAGYYILDCQDLDEAIHYASQIPTKCGGGEGCVEIRPIAPLPSGDNRPKQPSEFADALHG